MQGRRLWAIVLAGGEGTRLAEMTRRLYGCALPKQFVAFGQQRTFIQATVDRLTSLVPPSRMVTVVPRTYEDLARQQLEEFAGMEIVAQPKNVGTGPGVLLPLLHVLRRDPQADVALIPSDHDFRAPMILRRALAESQGHAHEVGSGVVLLGAAAENPACDLGWIVTQGTDGAGAQRILRFVEKPKQPLANRLFRQGALWNTMLAVVRGEALWNLAAAHLPRQVEHFNAYADSIGSPFVQQRLDQVYESMPSADFSRDLIGAARGLYATSMDGAGWSDCGTPERLASAFGCDDASAGKAPASHVVSTGGYPSRQVLGVA
jgi:mannose-1-phosphate guanylyltransferase